MIYLSLLLFMIAGVAYSIHESQVHGKLRWAKNEYSYWGKSSWLWKYKWRDGMPLSPIYAPENLYYKWFKISYKERFPGSATILVGLTDGAHAMQFVYLLAFSASAAVLTPHPWIYLVAFRVTIGITFTIFYRLLAK